MNFYIWCLIMCIFKQNLFTLIEKMKGFIDITWVERVKRLLATGFLKKF